MSFIKTINNPCFPNQIGCYSLDEKIYEDNISSIYKATNKYTQTECSSIIYPKELSYHLIACIHKEIFSLKMLKHKNILSLYEVVESENYIYLFTELREGKDLFEYITQRKRLSEKESHAIFHQLVDAMKYMHRLSFAHLDIRPENIILDTKGNIKLTNFGMSMIYNQEHLIHDYCKLNSYSCPEMFLQNGYSGLKCDVWSCGVLLYAMICGFLPFCQEDDEENKKMIINGNYLFPERGISDQVKDLIKNMLEVDPQKRYDFYQIISHPWFTSGGACLVEGLNVFEIKYPIDKRLLLLCSKYGFDKDNLSQELLNNSYTHGTAVYKLCVKMVQQNNKMSCSDLCSQEFVKYMGDQKNKYTVNYSKKKYEEMVENERIIIEKIQKEEEELLKKEEESIIELEKILEQNKPLTLDNDLKELFKMIVEPERKRAMTNNFRQPKSLILKSNEIALKKGNFLRRNAKIEGDIFIHSVKMFEVFDCCKYMNRAENSNINPSNTNSKNEYGSINENNKSFNSSISELNEEDNNENISKDINNKEEESTNSKANYIKNNNGLKDSEITEELELFADKIKYKDSMNVISDLTESNTILKEDIILPVQESVEVIENKFNDIEINEMKENTQLVKEINQQTNDYPEENPALGIREESHEGRDINQEREREKLNCELDRINSREHLLNEENQIKSENPDGNIHLEDYSIKENKANTEFKEKDKKTETNQGAFPQSIVVLNGNDSKDQNLPEQQDNVIKQKSIDPILKSNVEEQNKSKDKENCLNNDDKEQLQNNSHLIITSKEEISQELSLSQKQIESDLRKSSSSFNEETSEAKDSNFGNEIASKLNDETSNSETAKSKQYNTITYTPSSNYINNRDKKEPEESLSNPNEKQIKINKSQIITKNPYIRNNIQNGEEKYNNQLLRKQIKKKNSMLNHSTEAGVQGEYNFGKIPFSKHNRTTKPSGANSKEKKKNTIIQPKPYLTRKQSKEKIIINRKQPPKKSILKLNEQDNDKSSNYIVTYSKMTHVNNIRDNKKKPSFKQDTPTKGFKISLASKEMKFKQTYSKNSYNGSKVNNPNTQQTTPKNNKSKAPKSKEKGVNENIYKNVNRSAEALFNNVSKINNDYLSSSIKEANPDKNPKKNGYAFSEIKVNQQKAYGLYTSREKENTSLNYNEGNTSALKDILMMRINERKDQNVHLKAIKEKKAVMKPLMMLNTKTLLVTSAHKSKVGVKKNNKKQQTNSKGKNINKNMKLENHLNNKVNQSKEKNYRISTESTVGKQINDDTKEYNRMTLNQNYANSTERKSHIYSRISHKNSYFNQQEDCRVLVQHSSYNKNKSVTLCHSPNLISIVNENSMIINGCRDYNQDEPQAKTYSGPIDLVCIASSSLIGSINNLVLKFKDKLVIYSQRTKVQYFCWKNDLSFEIEIVELATSFSSTKKMHYYLLKVKEGMQGEQMNSIKALFSD